MPDKANLLHQRFAALEADAHFAPSAPREGESRADFAERRIDELEEAAKREPSGLARDVAYAKAAVATGVEKL